MSDFFHMVMSNINSAGGHRRRPPTNTPVLNQALASIKPTGMSPTGLKTGV